jgi:hypothetical protein
MACSSPTWITLGDPGIEIADSVDAALTAKLAAGLGLHRAWDRAATVMVLAAPPVGWLLKCRRWSRNRPEA